MECRNGREKMSLIAHSNRNASTNKPSTNLGIVLFLHLSLEFMNRNYDETVDSGSIL